MQFIHLRCPALVCHLYHPESSSSAALDLCLEDLAAQYPGTRFIRAPLLSARSQNFLEALRLPASAPASKSKVLAIKDGCLVDQCGDYARRFGGALDQEGETSMVYADVVEQWLRHCHVLESAPMSLEKATKIFASGASSSSSSSSKRTSKSTTSLRRGGFNDEDGDAAEEEEEEEQEYYDCGLSGCEKTFMHSHIGLEGMNLPKEFGS